MVYNSIHKEKLTVLREMIFHLLAIFKRYVKEKRDEKILLSAKKIRQIYLLLYSSSFWWCGIEIYKLLGFLDSYIYPGMF